MKPIKPITVPRTITDLLDPQSPNNLHMAQKRLNALSNMQVQITTKDASGNPKVSVGRIQIQGDSASLQISI